MVIYSGRLTHHLYEVKAGVVSVSPPILNPKGTNGKMIDDEVEVDKVKMRSRPNSTIYRAVLDRDLPSSFRFVEAIFFFQSLIFRV